VIYTGYAGRQHNAAIFLLLALVLIAPLAHAATWTANNTSDPASGTAANCAPGNANTCTLRDAIAAAVDGDTIGFSVGSNQTITLTSNASLVLSHSVTIDGSGSPGLVIDGNNQVTVFVSSGFLVMVAHMSIEHGQATFSGVEGLAGGGIAVQANDLVIDHVQISNNSAASTGGGIYSAGGLTVLSSTVSGNSASQAGGIWDENSLHMTNSTVSGNSGSSEIFVDANAGVINSTIEGVYVNYDGTLTLANDIIVSCSHYPLAGATPVDNGGNFDAGTGCLGAVPVNSGSMSNAYLNLGPLQNNGGPTLTMLPGKGSAVIDAGRDDVCAASPVSGVDQRGVARPQGSHCDAGAVEVSLCYVKGDASGADDGSSWNDAFTDLQSALGNAACSDIWVARGVYKPTATTDRTVSFEIGPATKVYGGFAGIGATRDPMLYRTVLSGDIDSNDGGSNGIDANTSQIVGNNSYHVVLMDGTTAAGAITASTVLDGLTITGGLANGSSNDASGAGLFCNGASATCSPTLNNLVFSGNLAAQSGGALYNFGPNGTASPTVTNSTFSGNSAIDGGGIYDDGEGGGTSSPTLANVTFASNGASDCGGAIYNLGAFGAANSAVTNATFSGNSGTNGGGAMCDVFVNVPGGGQANPVLTNVVLWNNGASISDTYSAGTNGSTLNYAVVDSGCPAYSLSCSNLIAADPMLGALQDNGGATPTMMPGSGSSAIDVGLDSACTAAPVSNLDQRGVTRAIGTHCDIGAVEATNLVLNITDGSLFAFYGNTIQFVVTVQNLSTTDTVPGIHLAGFGTEALNAAGTSWFCTVGNCTTTTQSGPLADTATLAPSGTLTWLVSVPVFETSNDATANMSVHANAAGTAQDTDTLAIFRGTFDNP
jgi:predicted outer membrane repeat protein